MRIGLRWAGIARFGAIVPLVLAVGAVGCSTETTPSESTSPQSSAAVAPLDVAALTARLPERIRQSRTLTVITSTPFEPMVNSVDGKLTGFDIDMLTAIANALRLRTQFQDQEFSGIISAVQNGQVDLASRGIFDTAEREKVVDMVTYFRAGTQWAAMSTDINPNEACGTTVGAEAATTQSTIELPAKS
ncbi:transporter substrate-binding domain-containing protein [Gordonia sp. (in: high G+C Gram-positive bacteria)]|uniref:transporter substrate-binding domain-containing protein n=1 Tax=Gordonia sp. (in: high G+C Gram-positive bacteria) TaxID=84139 RepID=UPI003C776BBF